eukprot:Gb_33607 [translate_table: standard]
MRNSSSSLSSCSIIEVRPPSLFKSFALSIGSTRSKSSRRARQWYSIGREELLRSAIAIFISSASDGICMFSIRSLICILRISSSSAVSLCASCAASPNFAGSEWPMDHCSIESREENPPSKSSSE